MLKTDGDQISCMTVSFLVLEQIYEVAKTGGYMGYPPGNLIIYLFRYLVL